MLFLGFAFAGLSISGLSSIALMAMEYKFRQAIASTVKVRKNILRTIEVVYLAMWGFAIACGCTGLCGLAQCALPIPLLALIGFSILTIFVAAFVMFLYVRKLPVGGNHAEQGD